MTIIDTNQVCEYLRISRTTLYRYIKKGKVKYSKTECCGRCRFVKEDLLKNL